MRETKKCTKCGAEFIPAYGENLVDMIQLHFCEKCIVQYTNVKIANEIINFNRKIEYEKKLQQEESIFQKASKLFKKARKITSSY